MLGFEPLLRYKIYSNVGRLYNSKIWPDCMPISRVANLKPLNKSSTDKSVIKYTLDLCLKIKEELKQ